MLLKLFDIPRECFPRTAQRERASQPAMLELFVYGEDRIPKQSVCTYERGVVQCTFEILSRYSERSRGHKGILRVDST